MLELQIAIAKSNKYAYSESGDTVEIVEQPLGGFAVVMADGQGSGGAAKILSNMVVGKAIALLKDGAKPEVVAAIVHDYLYAYRGGRVTASLVIISADLKAGEIRLSRNSDCPVLILDSGGVRLLDEAADGIGTGTLAPPALYTLPLEAGMYLVAYTDGVKHAGEKYNQTLNIAPLVASAAQQPSADAPQVADHLLNMALERDRQRPDDDMSVLALHIADLGEVKGVQVRRINARVPFGG